MKKKQYIVMIDHWFNCQDGRDSMTGEYSGIIHDNRMEAEKELSEAYKATANTFDDIPYIKVV